MNTNTTRSTKGRKRGFFVTYEGPRGGKYTLRADTFELWDLESLHCISESRRRVIPCHTVESISDAAGAEIYRKMAGARLPAVVLISTALREYKDRRDA